MQHPCGQREEMRCAVTEASWCNGQDMILLSLTVWRGQSGHKNLAKTCEHLILLDCPVWRMAETLACLAYVVRACVAGCWVGLVLRVSRVIQVETPHFACQLAGSLHPYSLGMSYRDLREQGTLARRVLSLGSWEPVSVWIWHEALLGMPLARSLP